MKLSSVLRGLCRPLLMAVVVLVLSACSSIPLSTMMHFSNSKPADFFKIDANQLRIKASINSSVGIDLASAVNLSATLANDKGVRSFRLQLEKIKVETLAAKSGFFQDSPAYDVFWLKLSAQGIIDFKKMQQAGQSGPAKKGSFSAGIEFGKQHKILGQDVTLSIALKLAPGQEFITLIDQWKVELQ